MIATLPPAKSLRVDKDELFARLRYEPHAGQQLVHASTARFRVLACGVRWGKSTCAAMEAVAALLQPCKESRGWVVAPTYDLSQHIMIAVRIAFQQHLPHRIVEDDTRSQRFVVKNLGGGTSEMRGKSTDNPASLLGEGLDWVILDEAAKVKEEIWASYLAPRLVDKRGRALLISTPRGINWFFQEFRRGQQGRDPEYESWRGISTDNPIIRSEMVESEKRRLTSGVFSQEYLGVFEGEDRLPCEVCGGPDKGRHTVLTTLDPEFEPECPKCGQLVDDEGRSIMSCGPDGIPRLLIIDLSSVLDQRRRAGTITEEQARAEWREFRDRGKRARQREPDRGAGADSSNPTATP